MNFEATQFHAESFSKLSLAQLCACSIAGAALSRL